MKNYILFFFNFIKKQTSKNGFQHKNVENVKNYLLNVI